MHDSTILKLCRCERVFDILTGQPLRKAKEEWIPPTLRVSKQPCFLCDHEFYARLNLLRIKPLFKDDESNN